MHAKDIWNTKHFDDFPMAVRVHHDSCRTSIRTRTRFIALAIPDHRGEAPRLGVTVGRANVKHQQLRGALSLHVRLLQSSSMSVRFEADDKEVKIDQRR